MASGIITIERIKAVNEVLRLPNNSYNLDNYVRMSDSGLYYIGAGVQNSPRDYCVGLFIGNSETDTGLAGQLLWDGVYLYYRTRAGNPITWSAWKRLQGTAV